MESILTGKWKRKVRYGRSTQWRTLETEDGGLKPRRLWGWESNHSRESGTGRTPDPRPCKRSGTSNLPSPRCPAPPRAAPPRLAPAAPRPSPRSLRWCCSQDGAGGGRGCLSVMLRVLGGSGGGCGLGRGLGSVPGVSAQEPLLRPGESGQRGDGLEERTQWRTERERGASRLGTMAGLIKKQILKHLSRLELRAWAQARLRPSRVPEATRGFRGGGDWQPSRRRPLDSLLQRGRGRGPWSPLAPALRAGLASQRLHGVVPGPGRPQTGSPLDGAPRWIFSPDRLAEERVGWQGETDGWDHPRRGVWGASGGPSRAVLRGDWRWSGAAQVLSVCSPPFGDERFR